jgi:MFS family permease
VSLVLFSSSRSFWMATAALIPVGFAMMTQMGASNTLIQTMTPDHLRGRVMSVYSMMFMGMAPAGALLAGFLADRFGEPATVATGGVIAIAGSVLFGLRLPALRPEARQLILAQQMVGGDPAEQVTAQGEPEQNLLKQ